MVNSSNQDWIFTRLAIAEITHFIRPCLRVDLVALYVDFLYYGREISRLVALFLILEK